MRGRFIGKQTFANYDCATQQFTKYLALSPNMCTNNAVSHSTLFYQMSAA